MTVLVTGATGFIGRHLLARLTATNQPTVALMRRPSGLDELRNRVDALGGNGDKVGRIAGDLDADRVGIQGELPALRAVVHLGAAFAWGMDPAAARRTNVAGSLAVAELARAASARLVMVSGFMLANDAHLQALRISTADRATDWSRVYRKVGAYEASKLESALRVRAFAAEHALDLVEVQPATLSGHSATGELDHGQPLAELIGNIAHGRLSMIPGSPAHWLPLVSVDALASVLAAATFAASVPPRLLALDPATPSLAGLISMIANRLGRKPPTRYLPLPLLGAVLRVPGMARAMNTAPESLHFLQPQRFDTSVTEAFQRHHGLEWPNIAASIEASVAYWRRQAARARATA